MSSLGYIGIDPTEVCLAADVANGLSPHVLGTVASNVDSGGYKVYKWVVYSEEAAATDGVDGEVTYYTAIDGYKSHQVTSDLSASDEIGGGVLQNDVSDGDHCWIQIKGPATLSIALTAGTDGDPLTPTGAGDGTLDVNVATAANTDICAWAGDASDNEILCDFKF